MLKDLRTDHEIESIAGKRKHGVLGAEVTDCIAGFADVRFNPMRLSRSRLEGVVTSSEFQHSGSRETPDDALGDPDAICGDNVVPFQHLSD